MSTIILVTINQPSLSTASNRRVYPTIIRNGILECRWSRRVVNGTALDVLHHLFLSTYVQGVVILHGRELKSHSSVLQYLAAADVHVLLGNIIKMLSSWSVPRRSWNIYDQTLRSGDQPPREGVL